MCIPRCPFAPTLQPPAGRCGWRPPEQRSAPWPVAGQREGCSTPQTRSQARATSPCAGAAPLLLLPSSPSLLPRWADSMSLLGPDFLRGSGRDLALAFLATSTLMKSPRLAALGWWPPFARWGLGAGASSSTLSAGLRSGLRAGTYRLSFQTLQRFLCHWYSYPSERSSVSIWR